MKPWKADTLKIATPPAAVMPMREVLHERTKVWDIRKDRGGSGHHGGSGQSWSPKNSAQAGSSTINLSAALSVGVLGLAGPVRHCRDEVERKGDR
jgi:hypothetical protein